MRKENSSILQKIMQMKKEQWFVVLLFGVLLAVIALPTEQKPKETSKEKKVSQNVTVPDGLDAQEKQLAELLSRVEGVGKVQVMLTRKSNGTRIVEKDVPVTDKTSEESGESGGRNISKEHTSGEETIYMEDESGAKIPYVREELEPQIAGVLVVAEGGGQPKVVKDICEAVEALFGVEAHKIKVMKMN